MTNKRKKHRKKKTPAKKKYRIRYDIGSFLFGIIGFIASLLPFPRIIQVWTKMLDIHSSFDKILFNILATCFYNLWAMALVLGFLAEKNRQRNGKLICGVWLGLMGLFIIMLRRKWE